MITLAIEASSDQASVALLRGEHVAAAERWTETGRGNRLLFEALDSLWRRTGVRPGEIELFAVGRGPGRYSGLRSALTAARFLALPGARPVRAVSSGAALAAAILREGRASAVAVVGDARRSQYWVGVFRRSDTALPRLEGDWAALAPDALAAAIPSDALLVSSEFRRLRSQGVTARLGAERWITEDRFPDAVEVAALALASERAGLPSEPLTPLYLHPPVAGGTSA